MVSGLHLRDALEERDRLRERVEALTQALRTLDEAAAKHMHILGMAPDWKCEICEAREAARKLV